MYGNEAQAGMIWRYKRGGVERKEQESRLLTLFFLIAYGAIESLGLFDATPDFPSPASTFL